MTGQIVGGFMTHPGDIVLVHRKGFYSRLISLGQSWRFNGPKHYRYWTHVAVVIGNYGEIVEAVWPRIRQWNLSKYDEEQVDYAVADTSSWADQRDRDQVVAFALHTVGTEYGLAEAVSLGLWCITGSVLHWDIGNQLICSALAAEAASRTSIIFPQEPLWMTPAHHAEFFGVPGKS